MSSAISALDSYLTSILDGKNVLLKDFSFDNGNFTKLILEDRKLDGADLSYTDFSRTSFKNVSMLCTKLKGTVLHKAIFFKVKYLSSDSLAEAQEISSIITKDHCSRLLKSAAIKTKQLKTKKLFNQKNEMQTASKDYTGVGRDVIATNGATVNINVGDTMNDANTLNKERIAILTDWLQFLNEFKSLSVNSKDSRKLSYPENN